MKFLLLLQEKTKIFLSGPAFPTLWQRRWVLYLISCSLQCATMTVKNASFKINLKLVNLHRDTKQIQNVGSCEWVIFIFPHKSPELKKQWYAYQKRLQSRLVPRAQWKSVNVIHKLQHHKKKMHIITWGIKTLNYQKIGWESSLC